ncbi:MAG TPA: NAD(P)-dependent alcohol dehydrogenase [Acidimicrobiales bacterium]|nr:NAD(P)-dependent alcohol dehydrogenase [Acidimicrobiales bacterium]
MTVARAAVLRHKGGPLVLEEVELDDPRPFEVLVEMASVGVCRTDTHALGEFPPPVILGHEGAGTVAAVGSSVTKVAPGDAVLTTFATCGTCTRCLLGQVTYCEHFNELNFSGRRPDGSTAARSSGAPVATHFLGQSCFATHALVGERSVVPVPEVAAAELRPLGPFGCGFQTGAGAVLHSLRAGAGSSLAVLGVGAVGLAAVAAASVAGCSAILAVDTAASRLTTAGELGATHLVDAHEGGLGAALRAIVPGGLDYAVDTTGIAGVVRSAVEALHSRGTCAVVGAGASDELVLDWRTVLNGRTITGVIGGGGVPDVFLPQLVGLHRAGRFPVDRLIEYFHFNDVNEAIAASVAGKVVKPVLVFE